MNQDSAESAMPSSARVARRIWWFMVSNAADRERRMRTDEMDEAPALAHCEEGCLSGVCSFET